jgi:hypothetical protein
MFVSSTKSSGLIFSSVTSSSVEASPVSKSSSLEASSVFGYNRGKRHSTTIEGKRAAWYDGYGEACLDVMRKLSTSRRKKAGDGLRLKLV